MDKNNSVVQIKNLTKNYKALKAVDNVSFEVYKGEIFGLVGPNGAGKTTTIECIEGLRTPTSGIIDVLGINPCKDGRALRKRIGIQLQQSELPGRIKVWETMDLFSTFYKKSINWDLMLDELGLKEKRNSYFDKLSGGQKQRLFIALSLINDPELVFLDELTTGLDPQARRTTWSLIENIRNQGKTIFLTTHYMEEAERLCDRVAIIDNGKIIALDRPENLIKNIQVENRVIFNLVDEVDIEAFRKLESVGKVEQNGERITAYGRDNMMIADVVNFLTETKTRFKDLRTEQPNLEDVFLYLTGKNIRS
jgi:ABC-2 type transport system ATP-binding protein